MSKRGSGSSHDLKIRVHVLDIVVKVGGTSMGKFEIASQKVLLVLLQLDDIPRKRRNLTHQNRTARERSGPAGLGPIRDLRGGGPLRTGVASAGFFSSPSMPVDFSVGAAVISGSAVVVSEPGSARLAWISSMVRWPA